MNQGGYPWAFVYVNGHFELIQVPTITQAPAKQQYATGRWTLEEHEQFLVGLKLHGRVWKNIAPLVKTRSTVQIRTHAQKYFLSLQKPAAGSADPSDVALPGDKRSRDEDCCVDADIFCPKRAKAAADKEDNSDADSTDCSSSSGSDSECKQGDAVAKVPEHFADMDFDQCWDAFEFIAGSESKNTQAV